MLNRIDIILIYMFNNIIDIQKRLAELRMTKLQNYVGKVLYKQEEIYLLLDESIETQIDIISDITIVISRIYKAVPDSLRSYVFQDYEFSSVTGIRQLCIYKTEIAYFHKHIEPLIHACQETKQIQIPRREALPTLQIVTVPPKFANNRALALRQHCIPVDVTSEEERTQALWVIQELFEALYTTGTGVGLAAPQLGVLLRIFVTDDGERNPIALINPKFTYLSTETDDDIEGCLSIPRYYAKVTRAKEVNIQAISPSTWEPIEFTAKGFLARVLQHESDHLDGVLYIDHLKNINELERGEPSGVMRARRALGKLEIKPTAL